MSRMASPVPAQIAYYAMSGIWPLVAYRSFERVTGPKREPWLVKTVGLLVLVITATLAADPRGHEASTRRLAIGSIGALAAVDVWYAGVRRRISPIYLADALAQAGLGAWWLAWRRTR